MQRTIATISAALLLLAACGDGEAGTAGDAAGDSKTADIDVCSLLTSEELISVIGEAPEAETSEPAGPFTACSWGTGDVGVSIATSDSIILAPGEDECPSAGLGEESYACEGRIKFLTNGVHVTVRTINPFVTGDDLQALAEIVAPKITD
ncbi:MAG: hypothetical protein HKN46_06760 [Acidimicrobiia bacterium]|nr:hypothetical protein [Acidimicrobiia bacterium]